MTESPHTVAILVLPGTVGVDLAVPLQVFGPWPEFLVAEAPRLRAAYSVVLAGPDPQPSIGAALVATRVRPLSALDEADTVVVPGRFPAQTPLPPGVAAALRRAAARGARIMSICVGAFVLAEAGLLDGRPATTHWRDAGELRRRYPLVDVREKQLYVDDGKILTSAGLLAGVDLCLHVLRTDRGSAAADAVARFLVCAPHRDGDLPQLVHRPVGSVHGSLAHLRQYLLDHLAEPHTLGSIAARAGMSVRTLTRRFHAETGTTAIHWLKRERVDRARHLLETTDRPIGLIARDVGFASDEAFRAHFAAATGTTPVRYRRSHRGTVPV